MSKSIKATFEIKYVHSSYRKDELFFTIYQSRFYGCRSFSPFEKHCSKWVSLLFHNVSVDSHLFASTFPRTDFDCRNLQFIQFHNQMTAIALMQLCKLAHLWRQIRIVVWIISSPAFRQNWKSTLSLIKLAGWKFPQLICMYDMHISPLCISLSLVFCIQMCEEDGNISGVSRKELFVCNWNN